MTWVAAGIAAVLPQKVAGGLPSVLGLMLTIAAFEVTVPLVLETATVNWSVASPAAIAPV